MRTSEMSGAGLTPPILATLKRFRPSPEEVILWWLGQSGFALRGPNVTALIDPFLSGHEGRRFPPAFAPESAENIDVVFCTHEHLDHFDAAAVQAIAAASPHAQIVVPEPIVNMVTELGIAR